MRIPFESVKEHFLEKKMKKLEETTDKKLNRMNESFSLMKNMLIELRKENEELRSDRQFLLDRLKSMLMDLEKQKLQLQAARMAVESEKEGHEAHERTYHEDHAEGMEEEEVEKKEKTKPEQKKEEEEEKEARHIERHVETPLDELLEFVIKKGAIKISDAAKTFKVKEKQIEEWARILEEHELIEIHYPTIGKPVLKKRF